MRVISRQAVRGLLLACLLPLVPPALAEGTLKGRIVTFGVLAYDDPTKPLFVGKGQTVKVADGVEFGLLPEGAQNGLDVAPARVNIDTDRIEVDYPHASGTMLRAVFNGYVLRFDTECALFRSVIIDRQATTIPLDAGDLRTEAGALYINMAGQDFGSQSRLALEIEVEDCPMS